VARRRSDSVRPLQPGGSLGAPEQADLAAEIGMTITAPIRYAADARVVRGDERMHQSPVDALA
jgi:hypothetical protein